MIRSSVVLPQPLGPRRERNSPARTLSDTASSASVAPKRLLTPCTSTALSRLMRRSQAPVSRTVSGRLDRIPYLHPVVHPLRQVERHPLHSPLHDVEAHLVTV